MNAAEWIHEFIIDTHLTHMHFINAMLLLKVWIQEFAHNLAMMAHVDGAYLSLTLIPHMCCSLLLASGPWQEKTTQVFSPSLEEISLSQPLLTSPSRFGAKSNSNRKSRFEERRLRFVAS